MKYKRYKIIAAAVFALLFSLGLRAQKKDALSGYKEFLQVCNVYKQLPLYLRVEIKSSSSFVMNEEDTLSAEAEFFMKDGATYIRFGEFEQLVNDSVALLVSHKLQRMILYPDARPVIAQMKTMTGMRLQSNTAAELAKKYTAHSSTLGDGVNVMALESRNLVHGTSLHSESVEVQYDAKTKTPQKITATKRSLMPIDETHYETFKEQPQFAGKLLKGENNDYYLMREVSTAFAYKTISHDQHIPMPATIAERISKSREGGFEPVKKYENYLLTVN